MINIVIHQTALTNASFKESIDLALVCAAFDQKVNLIFVDNGVYNLMTKQNYQSIGDKNHLDILKGLEFYDIENIYVEGFDEKKIINRASYYLVNLKQNSLVSLYSSPKYFKARENILWAVIDEDKMIIASPEQIKTMKDKSLHLQIFSIKEGLEILGDVIASR